MAGQAKLQSVDGVMYIVQPDGTAYNYAEYLALNGQAPADQQPDMAIPPPSAEDWGTPTKTNEYQFGDVGSRAGNEDLAAAGDIWANAGDVTRNMLPESLQPYFDGPGGYALSSIPDMALGAGLGVWGTAQKGIGYGAEVADAGARGLLGLLGMQSPYAPGTGAKKLARDIMGGIEVAGVGPEARALALASEAAKPAVRAAAQARAAGIFDLLKQGRR